MQRYVSLFEEFTEDHSRSELQDLISQIESSGFELTNLEKPESKELYHSWATFELSPIYVTFDNVLSQDDVKKYLKKPMLIRVNIHSHFISSDNNFMEVPFQNIYLTLYEDGDKAFTTTIEGKRRAFQALLDSIPLMREKTAEFGIYIPENLTSEKRNSIKVKHHMEDTLNKLW